MTADNKYKKMLNEEKLKANSLWLIADHTAWLLATSYQLLVLKEARYG